MIGRHKGLPPPGTPGPGCGTTGATGRWPIRWRWLIWLIAVLVLGFGLIGLKLTNDFLRTAVLRSVLPPPLPPEVAYPPAPAMPKPTTEPVEALLARYEKMLADQAPAALAALQPGLSDAQIDALEAKHGFKLTPDLRALYRWRNGERRNSRTQVFPSHRFVPLDEAVPSRDGLRQQVKAGSPDEQKVYAAYAGHRDPWLGLIVDAAGDGYFFDPTRSEAEGSFFFCFAEDGSYTYFPAFRSYLAAVVEGHEQGAFGLGLGGTSTKDFYKAEAIWSRHGASNRPQDAEEAPE